MEDMRPEEHFGHKFRMIDNAIDKYMSPKKDADEQTPTRAQGGIIRYLIDHRGEAVCQRQIEEAFQISGATASNLLNALEKNGYIRRLPYEGDARRNRIDVTEKALAHDERIRESIERMEERITDGFTEEEQMKFRSFLDRALKNVTAAKSAP